MAEPFKHIYKADLNEPLKRFDVGEILATGDEKANSFEVAVLQDGNNVDLTGCAVYGYFIRPNEETMKVDGTAEGNVARVELTKSCYVYDGAFSFAIKIVGSGITQTVAVFDGLIIRTTSENIVDGDRVIYGLEDLLAQIAATEAAATNANTAAGNANSAAAATNQAVADANKWTNATANATAISSESQPTVDVTDDGTRKVIGFGIPAGKTPVLTFRATTGEPGTQVEIQQSGTAEAPVIDLTIPRGDTGAVDGIDYFAGNPSALGTASPGTANGVARGDHVHPLPTAQAIGAAETVHTHTPDQVGALPLTGGNMAGDVNFQNGNAVVFQRPGIDAFCYVTIDGAGNMVMALNKNGSLANYIELNDVFSYAAKPFGILSGGTGAADAATARANLGAVSMRTASVRVYSSGWATDSNGNMVNTVTGISDLYATDNVIVTPHPWHADNICLYKIRSTANGDGSITFHAFSGEAPTMDVYFNALILREG